MNVLFIAVDDLNNNLGCYGNTVVRSPHLRCLAARGVRLRPGLLPVSALQSQSRSRRVAPDFHRSKRQINPQKRRHFREKIPDVVTLPQLFRQRRPFSPPASEKSSLQGCRAKLPETRHARRRAFVDLAIVSTRGRGTSPDELHAEFQRGTALASHTVPAAELRARGRQDSYGGGVPLLEENRHRPFFLARPSSPSHGQGV